MSDISRAALFGKLNSLAYKAIEGAAIFCKLRGNPYVELVHWLHQIMNEQNSDLHCIVRAAEVDASRLASDMTAAMNRLPRGATAISDMSPHIPEAVQQAWVWATLKFKDSQVRTGYLFLALLTAPGLRSILLQISPTFDKMPIDAMQENFIQLVKGSPEAGLAAMDGSQFGVAAPGETSDAIAPAQMGKQQALRRFTVDLTQRARDGKLDAVIGRDEEIRQMVDILMRRRQNNPILTGEAGVGKTAVVEGFALRIANGDLPPSLRDVSLLSLDVGLLQAGASMKGEFEQRLRSVIDEVQSSPKPIVLFIDEVHTLVGAGGAAGTGDAANLLKPALARGTLRTIGATTWAEYKKYIEKDPALTRRFQNVKIDEPSEAKTLSMLRGIASTLERHHKVLILDEALNAAVKLSHRYIPDRQLPDKAVSVLDTACARVAVSHHSTPPEVEDTQRRIDALQVELEIIGREGEIAIDVGDRETAVKESIAIEKGKLEARTKAWNAEKKLVEDIFTLRGQLRTLKKGQLLPEPDQSPAAAAGATTEEQRRTWIRELETLESALSRTQGDRPLVLPDVDEHAIGTVVAEWTGIPVGRMVKDEVAAVLNLSKTLAQRIIGQDHALEMIARRVQTARAGMENPGKPIGVFMLAGPSGIGKTETALALAETLYGGEQNLITINMSEFQEAHTVATLKGAPPGYVGYGEGGVLTEAVRRKPYSVVLLDEVEKAHPDVHEIFFQVFDKGMMEDGEGRLVDFKNTLIILTTNVGTELIMGMCADADLMPQPEGVAKALRAPLLKSFPAALLGRIVTIPYYPLSDAMMKRIIRLQLGRIVKRTRENNGVALSYSDEVVTLIAARCNEPESGGRVIDAILTNTLLPKISLALLERQSAGLSTSGIEIGVTDNELAYVFH